MNRPLKIAQGSHALFKSKAILAMPHLVFQVSWNLPGGSGGSKGSGKADNDNLLLGHSLTDVDHLRRKSEVQIDIGWDGIADRYSIGRSSGDAGQQRERPEDAHLAMLEE